MNTATEILVNGFPRTVAAAVNGGISQTFVHSEGEFDVFFNHNRPQKNLYFNIARMRQDMRPITGLVSFDFDSPLKDSMFEEGVKDGEKINRMREDESLANKILGDVWSDTKSLVEECWERNVPVLTVFSGLGVHVHLLYQEKVDPTEEKATTSMHFVEECDLSTWDRQVITDTRRILRIPNSQRVDEHGPASAWCIPMTEAEVMNNSLMDMLKRCSEPKSVPFHDRYKEENRPKLRVHDDADVEESNIGTVPLEDRDVSDEVPDDVEYVVRTCIPLPCVRERFLRSNPDHMIRFAGAVHLFQAGFRPKEVQNIIRGIGWIDYDAKVTRKMTEDIWKNRYSELSCSKLKNRLGLCVYGRDFDEFTNDATDCETYDYTSGEALYPYNNET
jgi:hypothetical protein